MAKHQLYRIVMSISVIFMTFNLLAPNIQAANCNDDQVNCKGQCVPAGSLCLLEPPPGVSDIIQPGENAWEKYVNGGLWQWAIMIGVALAVLNGTIAGFQIMLGQRDMGKERFIWSVVGLVLLLFAGVILNFINPNAFTSG